MFERRPLRAVLLFFLLCLFILLWRFTPQIEAFALQLVTRLETTEMQYEREASRLARTLPVKSPQVLDDLTEVSSLDLGSLEWNGVSAAVDLQTATLYLSQSVSDIDSYDQLLGELTSSHSEYQLYLLQEDALEHLRQSVEEAIPLHLIVQSGSVYQKVSVVITTFPVLTMTGSLVGIDDEYRDLYEGTFILFDGTNSLYTTTTTAAQWHKRGHTALNEPKAPWKISLKDKKGDKTNENLLNLGFDDDWILNPLVFDDTKLREKIAVDLWNTYLAADGTSAPMSEGAYVEVVLDGRYQGLYLLRNRIDAKYLQLNENEDILFKGRNMWNTTSTEEAYEIIFSPFSDAESYSRMEEVLQKVAAGEQISNILDVNLFLNYLTATDNTGYKNMYYLLKRESDGYHLYYIPWDTDISLGIFWTDDMHYNPEASLSYYTFHRDFRAMLESSEQPWEALTARWEELRQTMYTPEALQTIFSQNYEEIVQSGAYQRDQNRWGLKYDSQDTPENLYKFLTDRLDALDTYYSAPAPVF